MNNTEIKNVSALEILDSRGNPTVLARVQLADGREARAGVPSGASTGRYEALELRDGEINRYHGKGVQHAVHNIKTAINDVLVKQPVSDIRAIDKRMLELDGTPFKSKLGANAMLAVSLACTRLAAKVAGKPLYQYIRQAFDFSGHTLKLPGAMMNIMNGGKHSDAGFSIQEIMIVPHAASFHERVRIGSEVFISLGQLLRHLGLSSLVGDEGGYAPKMESNNQAFDFIIEASRNTNFNIGVDLTIAIDAASTNFYEAETNKYRLLPEDKRYSSDQLIDLYAEWVQKYYLRSVEDGIREDDWDGWQKITSRLNGRALVVGDDLFVTNSERLKEGIKQQAGNAIIIKPNQIGTLTETIDCIKIAQANKYTTIISHRSGDTIDDFIADLAVGVGADYIKAGSLCRGERLAKYNRLLEIEMELGEWKPAEVAS